MSGTTTTNEERTAALHLRRFHKLNAIILITFLFAHLATHVSGVFGIEAYNNVQSALRLVYRHPVVEPLLLFSISFQLLVGLILLIKSLRRARPQGAIAWMQIVSGGVFLDFFMAQHLFCLGMTRLYFDLDTNFYWPASVMSGPPFIYYFAPYYFFGVWAVMAHIGIGLRYWLSDAGYPALAGSVGKSFLIGGAVISAFIVPIISGAYFDINLPQEWIDYLRFYDPDFEPW